MSRKVNFNWGSHQLPGNRKPSSRGLGRAIFQSLVEISRKTSCFRVSHLTRVFCTFCKRSCLFFIFFFLRPTYIRAFKYSCLSISFYSLLSLRNQIYVGRITFQTLLICCKFSCLVLRTFSSEYWRCFPGVLSKSLNHAVFLFLSHSLSLSFLYGFGRITSQTLSVPL